MTGRKELNEFVCEKLLEIRDAVAEYAKEIGFQKDDAIISMYASKKSVSACCIAEAGEQRNIYLIDAARYDNDGVVCEIGRFWEEENNGENVSVAEG